MKHVWSIPTLEAGALASSNRTPPATTATARTPPTTTPTASTPATTTPTTTTPATTTRTRGRGKGHSRGRVRPPKTEGMVGTGWRPRIRNCHYWSGGDGHGSADGRSGGWTHGGEGRAGCGYGRDGQRPVFFLGGRLVGRLAPDVTPAGEEVAEAGNASKGGSGSRYATEDTSKARYSAEEGDSKAELSDPPRTMLRMPPSAVSQAAAVPTSAPALGPTGGDYYPLWMPLGDQWSGPTRRPAAVRTSQPSEESVRLQANMAYHSRCQDATARYPTPPLKQTYYLGYWRPKGPFKAYTLGTCGARVPSSGYLECEGRLNRNRALQHCPIWLS